MKSTSVNISFARQQMRFDSNFHLSDGLEVRRMVKKSPYELETIRNVTKDIYCPGIFRRNYTNTGYAFLGGGDIQKADFDSGKYLKKARTPNWKILEVKKGWTLVTCGGTIGDTVFTNDLLAKCWVSQHVMRVIPNDCIKEGMLYAYLATKYGKLLLTTGTYGSVIPTISAENIAVLPIPNFPVPFQQEVDDLIQKTAKLREEAATILLQVQKELKERAKLPELTTEDYDFYGVSTKDRKPSIFIRNKKDITSTTINAFNHSIRIRNLKAKISMPFVALRDVLANGDFFTTGSFSRKEAPEGKGVMLINQSDIFDCNIKGKTIYKKCLKNVKLVDYGEVLIAGVGTLGENELFCRCVFASESLQGQLVSGEFLRMKTIDTIPSGYLFAWLNSDYGFRLIRSTQSGTKQCRPIQKLLLDMPVPLLTKEEMQSIDEKVRTAHSLRYKATINENKAISMVEEEIEKWQPTQPNEE